MIGKQRWAYKNLVDHVVKSMTASMPDISHKTNDRGDVTVLLAVDQFKLYKVDKATVLHLDGNRWHEHPDDNDEI